MPCAAISPQKEEPMIHSPYRQVSVRFAASERYLKPTKFIDWKAKQNYTQCRSNRQLSVFQWLPSLERGAGWLGSSFSASVRSSINQCSSILHQSVLAVQHHRCKNNKLSRSLRYDVLSSSRRYRLGSQI